MKQNQTVVNDLNGLLADATVFYQKLRHYHWNVAGFEFFTLHEKFELMYTAWATSIDEIAERILMIDGVPLHTMAAMLGTTRLQEDDSIPEASEMVTVIVADLHKITERVAEVINGAELAKDRGTTNLMDALQDTIDKDVWMLNALTKESATAWK